MVPKTKNLNDGLLHRVNYPLYCIQTIGSRHLLVGGGGGSAKTGVDNGFEIYEIKHNGEKYYAELVIRHETGSSVVMNCAIWNDKRLYIVVGQESHSQLYLANKKVVDDGAHDHKEDHGNLRQRKKQNEPGIELMHDLNMNKQIQFEIKTGDSIQTDFTKEDPLQRIVRVSSNGKLMVTGGTDGILRVWEFPRMTKLTELSTHKKEIDDIDFSPDNKYVVSIAKDGLGIVWDLNSSKEKYKLVWNIPEGSKYLFKRCRYGIIEDKKNQFRLFTLTNPLGKPGKQMSHLQQWDSESGKLTRCVDIDESLAALAVRDDGLFVAVGTMFSGSVSLYVAFSLQRVLHIPGAHSMFVTGLEFLPMRNSDGLPILSDSEASIVSISVDNRICIHNLPFRRKIPTWLVIILIIILLAISFCLCSYFEL